MNKQIVIIGNNIENRIGVNITTPIINKIQFKISFEFIVFFSFPFGFYIDISADKRYNYK